MWPCFLQQFQLWMPHLLSVISCKYFPKGRSLFTVQVHDTRNISGRQKNRFHFCFTQVINFTMFLVESRVCCFWTCELFCLIRATVVLNLYPTAGVRYLRTRIYSHPLHLGKALLCAPFCSREFISCLVISNCSYHGFNFISFFFFIYCYAM